MSNFPVITMLTLLPLIGGGVLLGLGKLPAAPVGMKLVYDAKLGKVTTGAQ